MFAQEQYELVDFGGGRKLERFGPVLLDRPSPAAGRSAIADASLWGSASARYDLAKNGKGQWSDQTQDAALAVGAADDSWSVVHGDSRLLMQLGTSGNVGLFPEQAGNWEWIADQVKRCGTSSPATRPRVLNLFAYTGGASLAAAAAGAEVTHVDSSAPTVAWAKRNAEASGMAELPVRWLVEDAMKFARREGRRGNNYHGVIVDPPTYGHGPKGKAFKFREHLDELLALCSELLIGSAADPDDTGDRFLLFTCHAPGFATRDAKAAIASVLPDADRDQIKGEDLVLKTRDGRRLPAGVSARSSTPAR